MRKKKKNAADGRKKESSLGETKDWGKLQTTLLDRRTQFMRILTFRNPLLSYHHLQVLLHLLLLISMFRLLFPWHVSHLTQIGGFITWEKWMLNVLIVGLCTGVLNSCLDLNLNLACAVSVGRSKYQN
jgi:hypothetical protein